MPRVFERYWRGRYERDREEAAEGRVQTQRGLGLTIARQAVEAQGGRLTVSSTEGAGATFVVWLPTSPAAEASAVVAPDGIHPCVDPLVDARRGPGRSPSISGSIPVRSARWDVVAPP